MTYDKEEKLINVVASVCRLELEKEKVAEVLRGGNCNIIEQLGFDSFLIVELIVELEQAFGFEFDMNALDINKLKYYDELKKCVGCDVGDK